MKRFALFLLGLNSLLFAGPIGTDNHEYEYLNSSLPVQNIVPLYSYIMFRSDIIIPPDVENVQIGECTFHFNKSNTSRIVKKNRPFKIATAEQPQKTIKYAPFIYYDEKEVTIYLEYPGAFLTCPYTVGSDGVVNIGALASVFDSSQIRFSAPENEDFISIVYDPSYVKEERHYELLCYFPIGEGIGVTVSNSNGYWRNAPTGWHWYKTDVNIINFNDDGNAVDGEFFHLYEYTPQSQIPSYKEIARVVDGWNPSVHYEGSVQGYDDESGRLQFKAHGFGILTYANGDTLSGTWENGYYIPEEPVDF